MRRYFNKNVFRVDSNLDCRVPLSLADKHAGYHCAITGATLSEVPSSGQTSGLQRQAASQISPSTTRRLRLQMAPLISP